MYSQKMGIETDTEGSNPDCPRSAWIIVFCVIMLTAVFSTTLADITGTTIAKADITSSLPLWGGGQLLTTMAEPTAKQIKLHHFDHLQCGTCHNTAATESNKAAGVTDIWKSGVDINKACSSMGCHTYDESMNHPVGVTVTGQIPEHMQTDGMGRITCITCHEGKQQDTGTVNTGSEDKTQDRVVYTPTEYDGVCGSCHAGGMNPGGNRSHWQFSNKAHLKSMNPQKDITDGYSNQLFASVDDESNNCLSCHEEVTAVIPAMNETNRQKRQRYKRMSDHPIGMNYQNKSNTHPGGFHLPMRNSDSIRLFEGRVGCGSCHSLYSEKKSYLTVEFKGGDLCRSCHNR